MPGKKRGRRKKGGVRKRKRRFPPLTNLLKPKLYTKLRYATSVELDSSFTTTSENYSANGIYSPEVSGGSQPLLRDEIAALGYAYYRVLASKITIRPIQTSTGNSTSAMYGVMRRPSDSLGYASSVRIVEDPRVNWSSINAYYNTNGKKPTAMVAYFDAKKHMSPEGYNNVTAVGSNPGTGNEFDQYFYVWTGSLDGTIDPGTVWFTVEIEYIVEFSKQGVIAGS